MGNDPPAENREGTLPRRDLQRNFRLGVINGTAFSIVRVFLDTDTVVTWLLIQLRASNIIIGLMGPFLQFCWFIPQLFVSGKVERLPRKITFYRKVVLWRGVALATIVLIVVLIPPGTWMLTAFLTVLSAYGLLTGLSALAFIAMLSKVIAPNRRGTFFGQRLFWGGIFAMGASSVVGFLLDEPDGLRFPLNFAVIFGLATLFFTLAVSAWSLVREPEEQVRAEPSSWREQLRRGWHLLRRDVHYRTFVLTRMSLMLAQIAFPFYIVYAKKVLGIPARMVSLYLTTRTAASLLSNLGWGWLGDRYGNRLVIRLTNVVGLSMPLLALTIGYGGRAWLGDVSWLPYAYAAVFVAFGMFGAGSGIGGMNYLLDLAPFDQRSLYVGFTNTLFGLASFAASAGGLIVEWAGYSAVMLLSAGCYVAAIFLASLLIEPRRRAAPGKRREAQSCCRPCPVAEGIVGEMD